MNIITEYPFWFVLFCFMLGALYALILYYKDKHEFSKVLRSTMFVLRFISVSIIAFLLLSPLLKTTVRTVEKPLIIIAQDNSQSVVFGKDSAFYKQFPKELEKMAEILEDDYNVRSYSFGEEVKEGFDHTFSAKQTNMAILFDEFRTLYSDRNVGAVIIASDGIYNQGVNPLYASEKIKFPLYTIALGDTNLNKDLILFKVNYNRIAYLGNEFPVEVVVHANELSGGKSVLNITGKNGTVFRRNIDINNDTYSEKILLHLEAENTGIQRFNISLSTIEDEISTVNNSQNIFIDILDARQKILILAEAPHPDISAIVQAIESNYNYEVEDYITSDFNKSFAEYNLVIMHQLPSVRYSSSRFIEQLNKKNIPALYILGSKTNMTDYNDLTTGLVIKGKKLSFNESTPGFNKDFTLFTMSDQTLEAINEFPPLLSPHGEYKTNNAVSVLFSQTIGNIESDYPLVSFLQTLDSKQGVIAGTGLWRWRMTDFAKNNDHNAFNEIFSKIVQYLSVKVDKSFFRIISESSFYENETVEFDAEVYNKSYELINSPDVSLDIINSEQKNFPFTFSKTTNAYHLEAGSFPVGNYNYKARVKVGSKIYQENGAFTVSPVNIESVNTIADHNLLYKLASRHDGRMFYPSNTEELIEAIQTREDIKSVRYYQKRYNELVNLEWLLIFIILLIAGEWFLRKYNGAY